MWRACPLTPHPLQQQSSQWILREALVNGGPHLKPSSSSIGMTRFVRQRGSGTTGRCCPTSDLRRKRTALSNLWPNLKVWCASSWNRPCKWEKLSSWPTQKSRGLLQAASISCLGCCRCWNTSPSSTRSLFGNRVAWSAVSCPAIDRSRPMIESWDQEGWESSQAVLFLCPWNRLRIWPPRKDWFPCPQMKTGTRTNFKIDHTAFTETRLRLVIGYRA